jgi:hypothetical protein
LSGYFFVHRKVFDHPIFKDEPYTEREAWMWLISEAEWKPTRARVGSAVVNLQRGELAHSLRYMQREWKWKSDKRVRTFLAKLESDGMISLQKTTQEITHITICNYEKFQQPGRSEERTEDAARTQHGRKEEEVKEDKNIYDRGGGPLIAPEAEELAAAFLEEIGQSEPLDVSPDFAGTLMRADAWHRAGWPKSMIIAETRRVMEGRPAPPGLKYFEKVFANAFESLKAPAPKGKPTRPNHGPPENLSTVARRLESEGISFGPKPNLSGARDPANGPSVRLLPEGGCERS